MLAGVGYAGGVMMSSVLVTHTSVCSFAFYGGYGSIEANSIWVV